MLKIRCCTKFNSMSRIFLQLLGAERLEGHDLVEPVHELRRELAPRGFHAAARQFARSCLSSTTPVVVLARASRSAEAQAWGLIRLLISAAPRLLVMKIMAREKSTLRLSPSVSVALSRMPSSRFHSASRRLFDFVEQHEAELHPLGVILIQHFLDKQRMRFAMSQVSGRRADQLRDLVAVLKLGAVDLDDRARILQQRFGGGFDDARLAGTGRTQEQEVSDRTARGAHARQMHLIDVDDLLDRLILSDNHPAQAGLE